MQKAIIIFASVWPCVAFLITVTVMAACTPNLLVAHEEEASERACDYDVPAGTDPVKLKCDTIPAHWELGPD